MALMDCVSVDNTFGPWAGPVCRGGFDFTLLFTESFLSIAPLAIILCIAPVRIKYLWANPTKVSRSSLLYTKLIAWLLFAGFEIALLVVWRNVPAPWHHIGLASAAFSFVGALLLGLLSFFEHLRTVRPSLLLNIYLLFTSIFDIERSRSYALTSELNLVATIFTTRLGFKVLLAIVEARGKRDILLSEYRDYSTECTSGIYRSASFWWLNELFKKGFSTAMSIDDLFPMGKSLEANNLHQALEKAWKQVTYHGHYSLLLRTMYKLKWPVLAVVPPRLALIGFNFCQPFLINRSITFSQQTTSSQTKNIGYGLIGAYILVFVGIAVSTGQYMHSTFRFITMIRGGLVSMLYSKATEIPLVDVDAASSITLMSADVERIVTGTQTAHDIWANLIEIALAAYLLQRQLGVACTIPIGVAVISLLGSLWATSLIMQSQALWLEAIERRIAATSAMLDSIKGVKMGGLTEVLRSDLQQLRIDELNISKKYRKLLIWTMGFSYISPIVSPILAFAVFSLIARNSDDSGLSTATVFTSLSLFTLLTEPLGSLVMALSSLMGAVGSFKRIQDFLSIPRQNDQRRISSPYNSNFSWNSDSQIGSEEASEKSRRPYSSLEVKDSSSPGNQAIEIEDGFFGWDKTDPHSSTLHAINMVVPRGKVTMVVGPVGCGKSTLIKAILGEVPVVGGTVKMSSLRVSVCDQTIWHANGTVQESIIGASNYDQRWYSLVVRSCALDDDLRQLPQGDQTQIGSKGIALSGGQSQRISIARAVYAQKDIIVLDDCLSGVDGQTENRIWHSLFGKDGLLRKCRATVLFACSSAKRLPYSDHVVVLNCEGTIAEQGSFEKLNRAGGYVSEFDLPPPDWNYVQKQHIYEAPPKYTEQLVSNTKVTEDDIQAESNRRTGDTAIYLYYIKSVGWIPTLIFVISIIIFIFGISFTSIWVKMWSEYNANHPNQRLGYYLGIYSMLGGLALVFLIISCWQLIITMVPNSGVAFHQKLLDTVLRMPMTFFSTTDTGVTLNRFSQDLMLIDMELPLSALNTFATFILCIGQMALIAVAAPYAAVSFPFIGVTVYLIQMFYLRTSRQLRFLDLEAKSPLYSQFTEILDGLTTIRTFGWQPYIVQKAKALLDRSQRPFYLLFAIQRWLTFVLDLVVAGIATILIVLVVVLRGKLSAGFVGVALLNVVQFSQSIKLLISFWTQLETHIGSIARIKNFTTDPVSEVDESEDIIPPHNWPSVGRIEFENIEAFHRHGEPVLSNVSLTINPGEKVGIVGRTGSGKSSLVLTIFRMIELSAGTVRIDKLPLHRIPRQTIRTRLIGLPQDAYLLPGSVRLNADPLQHSQDKDIIQALKDVRLWDIIITNGDVNKYEHPLDVQIDDLHFSHGQRQLFCIARAILRKEQASVVILDEATSNLDSSTDTHIQRLIRSSFPHHTLIAVSHKLDTILDFDKVVVMNEGQIVEIGRPHELLKRRGSWFKSLYAATENEDNLDFQDN